MPTFTNLTAAGSTTDATSYTTASVTPTANRLILIFIHTYIAAASQPPTPSVTGNGITYDLVRGQDVDNGGSDRATLFVFRGMSAAPSAGAVTVDFGATTVGSSNWSVSESSADVDTTGTNGSGAIVQDSGATAANGTSMSVSYPVAMTSGNAGVSAFSHQVNELHTERTNWTELSDVGIAVNSLQTQYIDSTDTAGSATWTTGARNGGIILEVKASGGGGGGDKPVSALLTALQATNRASVY